MTLDPSRGTVTNTPPSNELSSQKTAAHALLGTAAAREPMTASGFHPELQVERLGQYRLIRELGSGGMGIVYEAQDQTLGRSVALKVLRANLPSEQSARERFLREAQAMAKIDHPNVVTIYGVGEENGIPFMAMQLLGGETLEQRLEREPRLPSSEVVNIGRQIAEGLQAAHESRLIHRDIKPSNIWIESGTGRVKLLDFGLALAQTGNSVNLTKTDFVIGTPSYMSPEQARGEELDGRSDLFSLGIILYQMSTGTRPFEGPTAMAIMRNLELHLPARVNVKQPDIPSALSNLIMELLAKEAKDRPESARVVAERLRSSVLSRSAAIPIAPIPKPVVDNSQDLVNQSGITKGVRPAASFTSATTTAVSANANGAIVENASYSSTNLPSVMSPSASGTMRAVNQPRDSKYEKAPGPPQHSTPFLRLIFLLAVASVGIWLFFHLVIFNEGTLTIETDSPIVEVEIRYQNQVKVPASRDRKFQLPAGTYSVVLVNPQTGYKLNRGIVEIKRDASENIRVLKDDTSRRE